MNLAVSFLTQKPLLPWASLSRCQWQAGDMLPWWPGRLGTRALGARLLHSALQAPCLLGGSPLEYRKGGGPLVPSHPAGQGCR